MGREVEGTPAWGPQNLGRAAEAWAGVRGMEPMMPRRCWPAPGSEYEQGSSKVGFTLSFRVRAGVVPMPTLGFCSSSHDAGGLLGTEGWAVIRAGGLRPGAGRVLHRRAQGRMAGSSAGWAQEAGDLSTLRGSRRGKECLPRAALSACTRTSGGLFTRNSLGHPLRD